MNIEDMCYEKRQSYLIKASFLIDRGYMVGDMWELAQEIADVEETELERLRLEAEAAEKLEIHNAIG